MTFQWCLFMSMIADKIKGFIIENPDPISGRKGP
jgi:hypothetical protein